MGMDAMELKSRLCGVIMELTDIYHFYITSDGFDDTIKTPKDLIPVMIDRTREILTENVSD